MSLLLILALLSLDNTPDLQQAIHYEDSNIFDRLTSADMGATPSGELFLLSFSESKVLHYDAQGKLLGSFGRKGEGPGEFRHPAALMVDDQKVYVQDLGTPLIHVFQHDGTFLCDLTVPLEEATVCKVATGWVYANLRIGEPNTPIKVFFAGPQMNDPVEILSLPRGPAPGIRVEMDGSQTKPVVKINPAKDLTLLTSSADGKFAYIRPFGGLKIHVFDATQKKIVNLIDRTEQALPFNTEFGASDLAEFKERAKGRGPALQIVADFPKTFPMAREVLGTYNGNVVIRKWTGMPDKTEAFLVLDPTGKEQPLPCKPEHMTRVLMIRGNNAYINAFSEERSAYIVRIPATKIDEAVTANPLEIERQPRMLTRTN